MFAISFSLLLSYACLGISAEQLVGGGGKQIFLLAGQSNMSGRGGVVNETWDHFIPPESFPNPSILRLTATQNWVAANEPLHKDIDVDKTCGVGPGMAFANSLLQKDLSINGVVGLVPCAVGGTNISEWGRGGHLYDQLMKRAEAALQGGGTIRGLLWYQGESDTVSWEDAELYKRRLERVFVHLRADLLSPVLPIIQVALASGQGPYIKEVREGQLGIKLMNVKTVDAKGMQLQPDGLHLSTLAQVTLGEMLANAFLQLQTLPTPALSNASKNFPTFVPKIFSR